MRSMYSPISQRPYLASYLSDWEFPHLSKPVIMPGKRQKISADSFRERSSIEKEESSDNEATPTRRHPSKTVPASKSDVDVSTSTQASSRPLATITSNTSSTSWPSRDDNILINARTQGQGWSQIQKEHFPGKTANACRKRYERLVAKRRGSDWGIEKLEKLGAEYRLLREQTWKPLADAMGERWQDVEKACFERSLKSLLSPGRGGRSVESRNNSIQEENAIEPEPPAPVSSPPSPQSRFTLDYILTKSPV